MTLFIDHLPFHFWTDNTRTPPVQFWSIRLPVIVSESGLLAPPPNAQPQEWVLDTGNTGDAFAWRQHLIVAGLDPGIGRAGSRGVASSMGGPKQILPIRSADLWLVSNLAALAATPYKIELNPGIPFRDVPTVPDPQLERPLIGMRALRRARLRIELDFTSDAVSIWTPGP